jgi:hypothetical protein
MAEAAQQVQEFVPTAEQKRPHGAIVTQVYANQIGGFCTPDTEKMLASKHLKQTGILLRYSWEIGPNAHLWDERLYAFLEKNREPIKQRIRMSKEQARKELIRLERMYTNRPKALAAAEKKSEASDFEYMNALRYLLGLAEWDYAGKGVPQTTKELQEEFDELQMIVEPDARMAAVGQIKNPSLLKMLMLGDSHAAIRELAERKYGEAMAGGRR